MSLTSKELKEFDSLVGEKASIIASGIARLHLASPDPRKVQARFRDEDSILSQFPNLSNSEWTYADVMGGLCLVIDRELATVIFQIFHMDSKEKRFEYELYEDIDYQKLNERFHAFEMEDCVAGFHFSSEEAATKFFSKVSALKPRAAVEKKKKGMFRRRSKGSKRKSKKKKKNKSKDMVISAPIAIKKEVHVGIDDTGGFDFSQITPEWKEIFIKAGIRKKDLKNPETAAEIMNAISNQQMTSHFQAQPEYQNWTEEDLEQMYTPEVRQEYEAYQEEFQEYQNEIEELRKEQEELDRWQRENAELLNEVNDGVPIAPPRHGRRPVSENTTGPPIAPPRVTRTENTNEFASELQGAQLKKTPPPTPKRGEVQGNTGPTDNFANELAGATKNRKYMDQKKQAEKLAALEEKQRVKPVVPPKHVEPKYDQKKIAELDKMSAPKLPVVPKKTAQDRIKRNIYERSVEDEDTEFKPIQQEEEEEISPEVLEYQTKMNQAQSAAEKALLEAEKLQKERDEIMKRLEMLEAKAQEKNVKIPAIPKLPAKPKLPPPPKMPALPKLAKIPLPPPPPPEKPKITLPPPPKVEAKKEAPKKVEPKKVEPKKVEPPKKAPAPVISPPIKKPPVERKQSTKQPIVKRETEEEAQQPKPPGMKMPNQLMLDLMKGSELKTAPKPEPKKPKTVKPPPSALLEAISSGKANLRRTDVKKGPPKQRLSKLPELKGGGKMENKIMAKLAETIQARREQVGGVSDDEESDDSDWSVDS